MKKKFDLIVWDWDGTLADSTGMITEAIVLAAEQVGLPPLNSKAARNIIGLGLAESIKALYGDIKPEEKGVTVKAPKVASNGGAIPVTVKSDIAAKTVAVFQDANPEATVCVFSVPEGGIVDYMMKIKMKASGKVTAIVEGTDGKFYVGSQSLEVALGGCEG